MIYSLTGNLIYTDESFAVIECGGVGFTCYTTAKTMSMLPANGGVVTLFTHMNVREDAITLFGFYSKNELQLFRMLISISGVGPKAALAILSELSPLRMITSPVFLYPNSTCNYIFFNATTLFLFGE